MSDIDQFTVVLISILVVVATIDVVLMTISRRRDRNQTYKSIKNNRNNE